MAAALFVLEDVVVEVQRGEGLVALAALHSCGGVNNQFAVVE